MSLYEHDFSERALQTGRAARAALAANSNLRSDTHLIPALQRAEAPSAADIVVFPAMTAAPVAADTTRQTQGAPVSYRILGKRAFDVVVTLAFAPVWLTVIAIAALFVMLDGHNPFYTQERVGRNGRVFRMLKLRSMVMNADEKLEAYLAANPEARAEWDTTQKLKNDPRITRMGRIIRKTSIDELPQLFNVLSGEMSLVGPRPFMVSQAGMYDGRAYYDMAPGLTGLWQISDRNECSFAQRVGFDEAYHSAVSLKEDVRILVGTVSVVLRGTGY